MQMPLPTDNFLIDAWSQVQNWFFGNGPQLLTALLTWLGFFLVAQLFKIYSRREIDINLYQRPTPETVAKYNKISRRVFYGRLFWLLFNVTGITIALIILGVDALNILQGLGFIGIALSFAFQDMIKQYYAGFIILTQEPFNIGEQIKIGEINGVVKTIESRFTIIRDFQEHDVVIPNNRIIDDFVHIAPIQGLQRDVFRFHVAFSADVKKAISAGEEALRNTPGVDLRVAPRGYIRKLGISNMLAFYYTIPGSRREQFNTRNMALQNVREALLKANVEMADPIDHPD